MKVELLVVEDCPSRQLAERRLAEALAQVGRAGQVIERRLITTHEQAQEARFRGSPTILIDGADPFAGDAPDVFGVTCRVYRTATGVAGAPTVDDLVAALVARA